MTLSPNLVLDINTDKPCLSGYPMGEMEAVGNKRLFIAKDNATLSIEVAASNFSHTAGRRSGSNSLAKPDGDYAYFASIENTAPIKE